MEALHTYANTDPNFPSDLRDEINAEYDKTTEKKRANTTLYAAAHDVIMSTDKWDKEMTAEEIATICADELPAGFTVSKMRYAFRAMWDSEVVKHDNGKNPLTYTRR